MGKKAVKLGILTNVVCNMPLNDALEYFKGIGIEAVEIGCGGTPGVHHCDPEILLSDNEKFEEFKNTINSHKMTISAFSCHGNPVHPVKEIANKYDKIMRNAVLLAEKMQVDTICCFSGCPGSEENSVYPHWTTTVWPFDAVIANKFQWEKKLIPYWKEFVEFAKNHGVKHIAIEMHPGFCVYNPDTLLKLRNACGPEIGANFDPSHLSWQGIDVESAIKKLSGCIYHFHAKDTYIDREEMGKNGFFAPMSSAREESRPFSFRIPGNGSGEIKWKQVITALAATGYDHVISIEHEDNTMGQDEGIRKSAQFLNSILVREKASDCWWKESISQYQRGFLPKKEEV